MKYNKGNNINYPVTLTKGVLLSFIITLVLILILALVLTYTSISEGIMPIANSIIMMISIIIGSVYMSLKVNKLGWLNGGAIGLLYIIFLVLFGNLFSDAFQMDIYIILRGVIALITGAVGGMIGINLK